MKTLLLFPSHYTLHKTVQHGLKKLGHEVLQHDFSSAIKPWQSRINIQMFRLPYSIRHKWSEHYFKIINKRHIEVFDQFLPDVVFIYNNASILPETMKHFKNNKARIIFFMGDCPYFTETNKYYMHILFQADLVVAPDSFWAKQMNLIGINNTMLEFPGFDETLLNFRNPTEEEKKKYDWDAFFVGIGYPESWGYKRALYVSKFAKFNLKAYGNKHWLKWLEFFPELKPKFEVQQVRFTNEDIAIMSKCAKIYPVDANPAILNGMHLRVFDCIASGILPIVEYRVDHDVVFDKVHLPSVKNYNDAYMIARQFIDNDSLREKTLQELKEYTIEKYSADVTLKRIFDRLF
jgi:hypothetical protein